MQYKRQLKFYEIKQADSLYQNLLMKQQKQHFRYKIQAHIVKLHLNKTLNFQTKITWKRNVNKTQTRSVVHQNCQSLFDQTLELQLNLIYNHQTSKFQSKLTQFSVVVIYQGKVKSGGYVRYDTADILNHNFTSYKVDLSLNQCPDPKAYLQVVFDYEVVDSNAHSLFNQLSMLNPSGFQQDLSQIDFKDNENQNQRGRESEREEDRVNEAEADKQNMDDLPLRGKEVSKIHNILDKFESVSRKIAASPKACNAEDQNSTKLSNCQISSIATQNQQKQQARIAELESQLEIKNAMIQDYESKLETANRTIQELNLKLQLVHEKVRELDESRLMEIRSVKQISEREIKYREMYQSTSTELEQMKQSLNQNTFSKQQNHFHNFTEEVEKIEELPEFEVDDTTQKASKLNEQVDELDRINMDLQSKIASSTHTIAQLFNAAYEFGGAKLLDYLHNSIGLTEY